MATKRSPRKKSSLYVDRWCIATQHPEEMIESYFVTYGVLKKILMIHKMILWMDNKMNLLMTNLVPENCSLVTYELERVCIKVSVFKHFTYADILYCCK